MEEKIKIILSENKFKKCCMCEKDVVELKTTKKYVEIKCANCGHIIEYREYD